MSDLNLPHKKSYIPSSHAVCEFICTYVFLGCLLTVFSIPILLVFYCVWDNIYVCVTATLSTWFVLFPHNCWLYDEAKIEEKVHAIEKENGVALTSSLWLYFYYIVFGNLFKSHWYFYTRVLVMIVLTSVSWYLCTKYGVSETSFTVGIGTMGYTSLGFIGVMACFIYYSKNNTVVEDNTPSPVNPDEKPKKSNGGYFE